MGNKVQKYLVVKDRVEIYKDFALNLLYYIDHYYIDYDSLNTDENIRNHFSWCYNKVCDEFLLEEINFKYNNDLKEYFYSYYYHQYYHAQGDYEMDTSLEGYEKFWKEIFEIDKQKNRNIMNILIEIYSIYDKSINREKNILEIV